jgi:hypothetical protein
MNILNLLWIQISLVTINFFIFFVIIISLIFLMYKYSTTPKKEGEIMHESLILQREKNSNSISEGIHNMEANALLIPGIVDHNAINKNNR